MSDNPALAQLPIRFQPLLELSHLGVAPQNFTFQALTLQSDKFICVRETAPGASNVIIIDVATKQLEKRTIKADSAILNPVERIVALKSANVLQVFKLVQPAPIQVGSHNMKDPVEFWKWISPTQIALVTNKAVYHWDLATTGSQPVQVFARLPNLNGHQIINYQVNFDMTWMVLVGIVSEGSRIVGHAQLHSTEKNVSNPIDGHAATFVSTGSGASRSTLFCVANRNNPADPKLYIGEVGNKTSTQTVHSSIYFPDNAPQDFPVALEVSERYKVVYLITKEGYFHLYDLKLGKRITVNKISAEPIFASCPHSSSSGIMCINKAGQVLALTVNEQTIIPYIINQLNDINLAVSLAGAANLPGVEGLVQQQFTQAFQSQNYPEAARIAAESPGGILRTAATINLFKNLPSIPGAPSPLLNYFSILLDKSTLNEQETLELIRPVLQQGRKDLIQNWIKDDKLFYTESLGDMVRQLDPAMGLQIYDKAGAKLKVVQMFAEMGRYDALVAYCKRENFQPNWMQLLQAVVATNPTAAVGFARMLLMAEGGPLIDPNAVVDAFMARQLVKETTSVLLDALANNRPEDAALQTRLLEINLKYAPRVAEAIFDNKMFTHYDAKKIAQLCDQAGLTHRALQHATDLNDIKRILMSGRNLTPDFVIQFFARLDVNSTLEVLRELLRNNLQQNIDLVVAVGIKYTPPPTTEPDPEQLHPEKMIALFEEFNAFQGTYNYLKSIVALYKTNKNVVFKFIEAAAKVATPEAIKEIELACRQYEYDPLKVKDFLKEARLSDQMPLIVVCNEHGFVADMTHYLYKSQMMNCIDVYCQQINPSNTPIVIGVLLDESCDEEKIKGILHTVGHLCPIDSLVDEVEKRNKLKMLRPWLEARFAEGNREPATHNALAKILITTHDERREQFLLTNEFYESRVVGKFCENHDPLLAVVAYKRGKCHYELIEVTNKNLLFKQQARYLVEEQNSELWSYVLREDNEHRRQVINEVVQTALPETKRADLVSSTVKAFMTAKLPNELIELLEKIVLEGTEPEFRNNRHLQNLLLLTAIKADKSRVMEYVNKLDAYDALEIAEIAIESDLFEEAFTIFKKSKMNVEAIGVLIKNMKKLDQAYDFAETVSEPAVYSKLGEAQLKEGDLSAAISSFLKAEDPEFYEPVIAAAKNSGLYDELASYLKMCRNKKARKEMIDSELAYIYAKTNHLADLEEFISSPNIAQLQEVGDRCFSEKLYKAARILYNFINNYARLASTLIKLQQWGAAVEAARKASSVQTWKEVNKACVDAREFRYAQQSGQNIILHADELEEICRYYEVRGHTDELIALLESGLGLDRAHVGIFTELAVLYSKYKPAQLMGHLNVFRKRLNISKVCQVCKENRQWQELAFLYETDNDNDRAARVMIEHSVDAWDDIKFREIIVKVSNLEICYEAVKFYIEQHPDRVNDLLAVLTPRIDPAKAVERVRKLGHLPIIKRYLASVQEKNIRQVNEALNELYIEEEDFDTLKQSIDTFDNFDSIVLARKLETHGLLEFRRVAAHLYKLNKRWKQSIEISKQQKVYKDAMQTAAESKDRALAEDLLSYFVELPSPHCFAACLYTCYELVRPDVALELAWRNKMTDFAFPFLIQHLREANNKIDSLTAAREKETANAQQQTNDLRIPLVPGPGVPPMNVAINPMSPPQTHLSLPGVSQQQFVPPFAPPPGFPAPPAGFPAVQNPNFPQHFYSQ